MKILVIEPHQKCYVRDIDGSLRSMQDVVGGFIEQVYISSDEVLICNEEGKLLQLPYNMTLGFHVLHGTCFICGYDSQTGEYKDVPEHVVKVYERMINKGGEQ